MKYDILAHGHSHDYDTMWEKNKFEWISYDTIRDMILYVMILTEF